MNLNYFKGSNNMHNKISKIEFLWGGLWSTNWKKDLIYFDSKINKH